MTGRMLRATAVFCGCGSLFVALSCTRPAPPLDLLSWDPEDDQRKIASYYAKEASALRQKAALISEQADTYALLFGLDSEWATSARLLAEFYQRKADEQERLASQHLPR